MTAASGYGLLTLSGDTVLDAWFPSPVLGATEGEAPEELTYLDGGVDDTQREPHREGQGADDPGGDRVHVRRGAPVPRHARYVAAVPGVLAGAGHGGAIRGATRSVAGDRHAAGIGRCCKRHRGAGIAGRGRANGRHARHGGLRRSLNSISR